MDLSTRLAAVLRYEPSAVAISQDGRWDTWGDVAALGESLGRLIDDLPADAFVAIVGRNHTATIAALLRCLIVGRPVLMLNNMQPDAVLAEEITSLRPAAIAAVPEDWTRAGLLDAARDVGSRAIEIDRAPSAAARVVVDGTPDGPDGYVTAGAGCALSLKTSGSTSAPKRVEISRSGLAASIDAVTRHHGGDDEPEVRLRSGVTIQMLSLAHTSAIQSICVTVSGGRRLALLDRFEPVAWARAVRDHGVVTTGVPPAGLRMILDADIDPSWLSSLRAARAGSAPLEPVLAEEFEERFGVPVLQAYGATELQGLASWTLKDHRRYRRDKRGAVGRVHPGVEIRVVDAETGAEFPVGEPGLLEVRTAQAAAASGEWIRTTDIARFDEDGFLWILGRADGAINRGGFKIDAAEVVRALREHPLVADAAVVSIPDARLGEVPAAAVEPKRDGEAPDEAELVQWLRARLEAYKVPRPILVLDELPRTIAMKPDNQLIRELVRSAAADRTASNEKANRS
ncbi:MAG: fatty acid--CoA ligase family protein [Microbacterium sp.]